MHDFVRDSNKVQKTSTLTVNRYNRSYFNSCRKNFLYIAEEKALCVNNVLKYLSLISLHPDLRAEQNKLNNKRHG